MVLSTDEVKNKLNAAKCEFLNMELLAMKGHSHVAYSVYIVSVIMVILSCKIQDTNDVFQEAPVLGWHFQLSFVFQADNRSW